VIDISLSVDVLSDAQDYSGNGMNCTHSIYCLYGGNCIVSEYRTTLYSSMISRRSATNTGENQSWNEDVHCEPYMVIEAELDVRGRKRAIEAVIKEVDTPRHY
jgi:hypothetical protein